MTGHHNGQRDPVVHTVEHTVIKAISSKHPFNKDLMAEYKQQVWTPNTCCKARNANRTVTGGIISMGKSHEMGNISSHVELPQVSIYS
jgi:hypothetical protein